MENKISKHKEEYNAYIKSKAWYDLKNSLIKKRGKRCERCNKESKLQLHHKTYKRLFNELSKDLILLCGECHTTIHKKKKSKVKEFFKVKRTTKEIRQFFKERKRKRQS